jgi:hypothetical protein
MRSCARRILLAATISIAFVIFCVLFTLEIFERISFVPGMLDQLPRTLARALRSTFAGRRATYTRFGPDEC